MPTRLIIHTDSISSSDVNTFKAAAMVLEKDYKRLYPKDTIERVFVKSGKEIADAINAKTEGAIISLDIVSHGNQGGIHIARKLAKPIESGMIQKRMHVLIRENTDRPQSEADAEMIEESMHGLYSDWSAKKGVSYYYNQDFDSSQDIAILDNIKFTKFAKGAFIEFHGCRTAEIVPVLNTILKDNFAQRFSKKLPDASVVVGHITNSNPNKNPNGKSSDYRHGRIRSYQNGTLKQDSTDRKNLTFKNSSTP